MWFYVTVQPKKDKSIIHELAQCIIDLFFGRNSLSFMKWSKLKLQSSDWQLAGRFMNVINERLNCYVLYRAAQIFFAFFKIFCYNMQMFVRVSLLLIFILFWYIRFCYVKIKNNRQTADSDLLIGSCETLITNSLVITCDLIYSRKIPGVDIY